MFRQLLLYTLLPYILVLAVPHHHIDDRSPSLTSYADFHKRQEVDDPAPSITPEIQPGRASAPKNVYGGKLICHTGHISTSNGALYMTRAEAADAISDFCGGIQPGVIFKSVNGTPFQAALADGPYNQTMQISAQWVGGSNCPEMHFSNATNVAVCKQNLLRNIIDECNTAKNGLDFWKAGGNFTMSCMKWNIQRQANLW